MKRMMEEKKRKFGLVLLFFFIFYTTKIIVELKLEKRGVGEERENDRMIWYEVGAALCGGRRLPFVFNTWILEGGSTSKHPSTCFFTPHPPPKKKRGEEKDLSTFKGRKEA